MTNALFQNMWRWVDNRFVKRVPPEAHGGGIPDAVRRVVARLLNDYQFVGLYQDQAVTEFVAELNRCGVSQSELGEFAEQMNEPRVFLLHREYALARIRGLVQGHRFAGDDVLNQAQRLVPGLAWEKEQRGPKRRVGRLEMEQRRIALLLEPGGHRFHWSYATVPGLVEGLNRFLRNAGWDGKFIGLWDRSDRYLYVWGDEALERQMAGTGLFKLDHESDELAGPVEQ